MCCCSLLNYKFNCVVTAVRLSRMRKRWQPDVDTASVYSKEIEPSAISLARIDVAIKLWPVIALGVDEGRPTPGIE